MSELKEQAQALAGESVTIVGAWQEPTQYIDRDGNNHGERTLSGCIERVGTVLVSNGQWIGRGETVEAAVADLLENVSK